MIIIKTRNRIINIYYQFIMIYSIQFIFYFCNKIARKKLGCIHLHLNCELLYHLFFIINLVKGVLDSVISAGSKVKLSCPKKSDKCSFILLAASPSSFASNSFVCFSCLNSQ